VKARVLQLDSDQHLAAQILLPWYANATLDPDETACVEAHLVQCPRCQADVEFQRRLAADPPQEPESSVDRGWLALRARLEPTAVEDRPLVSPAQTRRPAAPARAWGMRWLPLALGVQAVLTLLLATVWLVVSRPAEYRTLGTPQVTTAANALVVFRAEATEADIRRALHAADARIVGGPTVTDAWLLRLPEPGAAALARLRAAPAVARVESLEGEPRR